MFVILLQSCVGGSRYFAPVDSCIFNGSRENLIVPEITTLNIYWELGVVQLLGHGLHIYSSDEYSKNIVSALKNTSSDSLPLNSFCSKRMDGALIGERIFNTTKNKNLLNAECLYEMRYRSQDDFNAIESFFYSAFGRKFLIDVVKGFFYVYYVGDEIRVVPDSSYVHKKIGAEERKNACSKYRQRRVSPVIENDCPKYEYEFIFPIELPIYSITVLNNSGWGYVPLKLDPSLLPLESPGYKKLREQEESLLSR